MNFLGWMYDVAREQSPSEFWLNTVCERTRAAGYDGLGLYLEHRFEYPSAPWAAGPGCLTTEVVRRLASTHAARGLRVIPFLNTLGHLEGFIRAEGGQWLAEGETTWGSEQICPTRAECVAFARGLVEDALAAFDDEWVHIGGDETRQLGQCPHCAPRAETEGKGGIYGVFYGALCRWLLERGRRPCLWADMVLNHPEALEHLPPQTLLFDWQYDHRPCESTHSLRARGFDVVCCPSVQSYNSVWCHLDDTQRNIDEHLEDARALDCTGVLVTTWEASYFQNYDAVLPLVYAAGRRARAGVAWNEAMRVEGGADYVRAAEVLGREIPAASSFLRQGSWRQLRDALVMKGNPFVLWRNWRHDAVGPAGDAVLRGADAVRALVGDEHPMRLSADLYSAAVEWVRSIEAAYQAYASREHTRCAELVRAAGARLDATLRPGLERAAKAGGSKADLHRLTHLVLAAERAAGRVQELDQTDRFRPAFYIVTHPAHAPGDQAAWRVTLAR